jgi:hypothetical protein
MNGRNGTTTTLALAAAVALGIAGFVLAMATGSAQRVWEAFLVNLLFWMGIAQGGICVSASFYLTNARWGGAGQYRLAEAFVYFLPLSFLMFWALYFGRHQIFVWADHPLPEKADWLNVPFLFARDGAALALMTLLSLYFVRLSRRADVLQWAASSGDIGDPPKAIRRLAVVMALSYAYIYSLIAFDLVMSLAPRWHSTLFGAYFFAGAYWSAIVMMALCAIALGRNASGQVEHRYRDALHDIGKLIFACSVFWVYLLFAQYIVIWYGDIPAETFYVVPRVQHLPWGALGWSALILIWAVPFCVLMGKRPKRTPPILATVCVLGLIGMWIERYVLVVPSLSRTHIPFGWVEVLITLGFFGAFGLTALPGLRMVPAPALVRPADHGGAH